MAGSFLGMLPGTFAYVAAGNYGKEVLLAGGEHSGPASWQMIGVGVLTIVIIYYIGQLAKTAMVELEAEDASSSLSSEVGGGEEGGATRAGDSDTTPTAGKD